MEVKLLYVLQIAVILLTAYVCGYLSEKLKQPAVLGQILGGLALAFLFDHITIEVEGLAQIGVILLMFIAGLETDVKELLSGLGATFTIALGGIIMPVILVMGTMMLVYPGIDYGIALLLGIVTTATSVSISVQTLREMDKLRTKEGVAILGAAIIDDVVGIILLTLFVAIFRPGSGTSPVVVIGEILLLILVIAVLGFVMLKVVRALQEKYDLEKHLITLSMITCFALAFFSEEMGVAAITGSYFAGVIFSMTDFKHRISHEINQISANFFTPIFFVAIGMSIDIVSALSAVGVGLILSVMGSLGKYIGCGLGARLTGFNWEQSGQIGIGMIPRAEVAIIVASLGLQMNILRQSDVAATVLMVLITTLITPVLLKKAFKHVS